MSGRSDRISRAGETFSCPWCSGRAGYLPEREGVRGWTSSMIRGAVRSVRPEKDPGASIRPTLLARCTMCHERVGICGHCGHPNRSAGLSPLCDVCGRRCR
jgi:hypothetical protein